MAGEPSRASRPGVSNGSCPRRIYGSIERGCVHVSLVCWLVGVRICFSGGAGGDLTGRHEGRLGRPQEEDAEK